MRSMLRLIVLSCLLVVSSARAQTEVSEPPGYRESIDEAVREFGLGHFTESRAMFARAHALLPNARTERGLGMAEFELRNYADSIVHLEAALASRVRPLSDELRVETERTLERANNFVARLLIVSRPLPINVTVDGRQVDFTNPRGVLLEVGEHALELYATGYAPESRRVQMKTGGVDQSLEVTFMHPTVVEAAPPPIVHESPREDAPRRWYKSPWLWAGAGVLVAGAVTGIAIAVARDDGGPRAQGGNTGVILNGPR